EDILDKINQLVDAYNELVEEIQAHTVYDPDNPDDTGVLFGNSTLHIIYDNIRRAMTSPVAGKDVSGDDGFSALSQIGLTLNSENQISIDDSILEDKLADNFEDVLNLFVSNGSGDYQVVTSNYLTQGGSYSTRIVDLAGGDYRLELKLEGSSEWITLEQSGQYAIGESGSLLEGVIIKTGELTAANLADVGNIDIYNGIAKVIQGYSGAFTALSSEGLIYNQLTTISNRDSDLEKEIENLNERVSLKEAELQREFAALETLLSKLKTEERYLTTQLEALVTN
ncbi:MAG: flagellar filament capping protein FliD, partial [Nitrospinota bacterium]